MSNYDGKIEPIPQKYLDQTDEVLSPDEEVIHDQNKRIEQLKQKVHILNEANMKLENTVGKLCEQLQEANGIIKKCASYCSVGCYYDVRDEEMSLDSTMYLEKWGVK